MHDGPELPGPPTPTQARTPARGTRRTFGFLVVLVFTAAAACGRPDPDVDGAATRDALAAPANDDAADTGALLDTTLPIGPIEATAEDSAIFRETIDRARAEGVDTLEIGPMVATIGRWFVGAPYVPGTLDPPGPERLIVNLRTFDCVTYVESMLALARVLRAGHPTFDAFARELSRIRYRDGVPPDYPARLHYFSDWIASNTAKGLVRSITAELGGIPDPEPIDFMSTHTEAYRQLQDTANLRAILGVEAGLSEHTRVYVPEDRIADVASGIREGDIIAATSTVRGLDIAHTGLALRIDGRLHLMHAPLVGRSVEISELPLADRIREIEGQDGIMVARPL